VPENITCDSRPYPGETTPLTHWSLTVDDAVISELWVDSTTGEIMQVETLPAHQGHGHASALYRAAAATTKILHAPVSHRTPEGDRFAVSVGGESLSCAHGCCDQD
jgi:GNAT superfamily N-acetyltransferase